MLDAKKLKLDFPILSRKVNGKDLVCLDNSATSQKPTKVLEAVDTYYKTSNANVHRGSHTLADEATSLYESSRETVAKFIGSRKAEEIVFVRNATEALNTVAYTYAQSLLKPGDEVLLGVWEHHSNLIPWQQVCTRTGAKLVCMYPTKDGLFDFEDYKVKLTNRTKVVTVAHASNVLGTIFPIKEITAEAKKYGAVVVIDGAQSAPHMPINVESLECDFFAFSGHKMLSPMGIGVLWVKQELLETLQPFMYGGGMILEVTEQEAVWEKAPYKFEAGTPNVSGAVGLAEAIKYLSTIGMDNVKSHEFEITTYALEALKKLAVDIPSLHILGPWDAKLRTGLISFYFDNIHAHDVSAILDRLGIAVRSGHHCAMPLHTHLGVPASCRASWYLYNTPEDIDALLAGLREAKKILL